MLLDINKYPNLIKATLFASIILFTSLSIFAQSCPKNIDFETGSFDGWTCYTGTTTASGTQNIISLQTTPGPSATNHTMYSSSSREVDPYGGFPVTCPNGSGYSVKLGNTLGGGQAEGISYEFTIPANQNSYALTFHYAVVFQAPNHRENEQPRMEIEIKNITDNEIINCASFTFISVGTALPGFMTSQNTGSDTTTVMYKDWTPVSVDLSGNAGKTIRLFFKTADCTFQRHFGYAYIDVNSECDGSFTGASYCPDDTAVTVVAPFGYESYAWYDETLTRKLGDEQTIRFAPLPVAGTVLAVKLVPYEGFGCPQTLYTTLRDSLVVTSNAGSDGFSCNRDPIQIGTIPKAGISYRWDPPDGLSNPFIANPMAGPDVGTTYVVTTTSSGGGCRTTDSVRVGAAVIDNTLRLLGKAAYCFGYGDSTILTVPPTDSIQWYKDNISIAGASKPSLRVNQSGTYYAMLYNNTGCILSTSQQVVTIDKARPALRYPLQYAVYNIPVELQARDFGQSTIWNPATNLDNRLSTTPTFNGVTEQLYTIQITTASGCITVDTQQVKAIKEVEVYVPTAFTPNNDRKNDYLRPLLLGIRQVKYFRIYNRWGNLLYQSAAGNESLGWDGAFLGIPQQTQTVAWMLEGIGLDGKTYIKKGTSVLLR